MSTVALRPFTTGKGRQGAYGTNQPEPTRTAFWNRMYDTTFAPDLNEADSYGIALLEVRAGSIPEWAEGGTYLAGEQVAYGSPYKTYTKNNLYNNPPTQPPPGNGDWQEDPEPAANGFLSYRVGGTPATSPQWGVPDGNHLTGINGIRFAADNTYGYGYKGDIEIYMLPPGAPYPSGWVDLADPSWELYARIPEADLRAVPYGSQVVFPYNDYVTAEGKAAYNTGRVLIVVLSAMRSKSYPQSPLEAPFFFYSPNFGIEYTYTSGPPPAPPAKAAPGGGAPKKPDMSKLRLPWRGDFDSDDNKHRANIRKLESWANNLDKTLVADGSPVDRKIAQVARAAVASKHAVHVHEQGSASDVWRIKHELDYQPNVTVVDSAGTQVEGDVEYPSANEIVARFTAPFSGRAYLS